MPMVTVGSATPPGVVSPDRMTLPSRSASAPSVAPGETIRLAGVVMLADASPIAR